MSSIVIAGGGVAGLSIAQAIRKRDRRVGLLVLEGQTRLGGNIRTDNTNGYVCEWGPDGFLDNAPATLALADELGLGARLLPSNDAARRRYVFRNRRLHEVPGSPGAFLRTPLLSATGKARIFYEPFARRRVVCDETIHAFAARRIGEEAASIMVDSMVSGIFAGNAHALSLRACFPKMWQMETDHGSLFRALLATRKRRKKEDALAAPAGRLTSFDDGMEVLIQGLARSLSGLVRTSSRIVALHQGQSSDIAKSGLPSSGYTLTTDGGTFEADAVVLAGPAEDAANLVQPFDSTLASLLSGVETAPLAVVCLGFDATALAADRGPLDGFGFLVPRRERIRILGALWETSIYARRAPKEKALIRVMIGGALDPEAVDLDDDALVRVVRADLKTTMGLNAAPELTTIIRHRRGIPQYTIGHVERLQRIDALLRAHPGLYLAGNSYRGVSINSCIAEADTIAASVLDYLATVVPQRPRARINESMTLQATGPSANAEHGCA